MFDPRGTLEPANQPKFFNKLLNLTFSMLVMNHLFCDTYPYNIKHQHDRAGLVIYVKNPNIEIINYVVIIQSNHLIVLIEVHWFNN
jgi:hypothetical protein